MRVSLQIEGGFAAIPGLQRPSTVDTETLGPDVADELERLVDAAAAAPPQPIAPAPTPGADQRTYVIHVEDGPHAGLDLRCTEPVDQPAFRALVDKLRELRAGP